LIEVPARYCWWQRSLPSIAQCLEVDVASQGRTIDEALANLAEAVELYLEEVEDPAGHLTATPLVTS
jgi:hypothetical protein